MICTVRQIKEGEVGLVRSKYDRRNLYKIFIGKLGRQRSVDGGNSIKTRNPKKCQRTMVVIKKEHV
jgi:hypothetical protein